MQLIPGYTHQVITVIFNLPNRSETRKIPERLGTFQKLIWGIRKTQLI